MADDPRIDGAVARLMVTHPSWFQHLSTVRNRNPGHPGHADALYAARTIAEAAVRGADAEDPLRVLLADERRALDAMVRAWWDGQFGAGSWPDGAGGTESRQLDAMRPVLAALRKVAGL